MTNGAIEVIRSISQCHLSRSNPKHDPVGLHVIDVVQHQPADRHRPKILNRCGFLDMRKPSVLWMKREWNKRLESIGLVLEFPQPDQMVNPVKRFFQMPVQHRAIGFDA